MDPTNVYHHIITHPVTTCELRTLEMTDSSAVHTNPRQRWLRVATNDVDRAGDILEITGMDSEHFLRNPQFLWQHGQRPESIATIGRIRRLVSTPTTLYALAEFAEESTSPLAEQIYRMCEAGYLPANSIGFRPIEWEDNDFGGVTFLRWELIECSKVELPMNPNAVDDIETDQPDSKNERSMTTRLYSVGETNDWLTPAHSSNKTNHTRPS